MSPDRQKQRKNLRRGKARDEPPWQITGERVTTKTHHHSGTENSERREGAPARRGVRNPSLSRSTRREFSQFLDLPFFAVRLAEKRDKEELRTSFL
jgi:hypothetical protein